MMVINDRNEWRPVTTQLHIMDVLNRLYWEKASEDFKKIREPYLLYK